MHDLQFIQDKAIEKTKTLLIRDMVEFIISSSEASNVEEYIANREDIARKIWAKVWKRMILPTARRTERKAFLIDKGYDFTNKKHNKIRGTQYIDKWFAEEKRREIHFDPFSWLREEFGPEDFERWTSLCEVAKQKEERNKDTLRRIEQKVMIEKKKKEYQTQILEQVQPLLDSLRGKLYVSLRHDAAYKLKHHLKSGKKYMENYQATPKTLEEELVEVGDLERKDYKTIEDFFNELTGKVTAEVEGFDTVILFETYEDIYNPYLEEQFFKNAPRLLLKAIPDAFKNQYKEYTGENLTKANVINSLQKELNKLLVDFKKRLRKEVLIDVLEVADKELNLALHQEMYAELIEEQWIQEEKEREELQKKKDEEQRKLEYIFGLEYEIDPRQESKYILHLGETNTGKTFTALQSLLKSQSGMYLAPLRLLALEVFEKLNEEGIACSLKTGEEEKYVANARHLSGTVEMFSEKEDFQDVVVIDESQMIQDRERGFSWYKAITRANAKEVHIIGSSNIQQLLEGILKEQNYETHKYKRDIPLQVDSRKFNINQVREADALIVFSRKKVLQTAAKLEKDGHKVSVIYGGMPPETRRKQIQQFINKETHVIVSTDAIGMGLNLPIRRVVLLENQKFDGQTRRFLTSQEVKQIAGRAGRKGLYDVGEVAFAGDVKRMTKLLFMEDKPIKEFTIAPTNDMLKRFKEYHQDLDMFFKLWKDFKNPKGTRKSSLEQEKNLYYYIKGTMIEAKIPLVDLYGYLQLPFSSNEAVLRNQWVNCMNAIVAGVELPEPKIQEGSLEKLELSYKAVGLHIMFLYRLEKSTEALYWERVREEISDKIHEVLKKDIKTYKKRCSNCSKELSWNHEHAICDACFRKRAQRQYYRDYHNY
ncbi:helicase-related protein [Priestia filamentosa]|uniref:helicase-related protein n=1 Tax=Priestia filamentosa TaxID=1402861 RepID=UPI00397BBFC5